MRRSALSNGTPGVIPGRRRMASSPRRAHKPLGWAAAGLLWALVAVAAHSTASAASPPWTVPEDFTDGFRSPEDGTPLDGLHYDGDVTPEDYVIDQITAYLQRAQGRPKSRPEEQPPLSRMVGGGRGGPQEGGEDEEEGGGGAAYEEDVVEEEDGGGGGEEAPLKAPAREGHGMGFTYRFPEADVQQGGPSSGRPFAVNPSDPKYYTATVMGRSGDGGEGPQSAHSAWDSIREGMARELEGGGPPERTIRPLGRFPVVKPIRVVSTTGTDIPPIHGGDVDEMVVPGGGGGGDKADMRLYHESPRDSEVFVPRKSAAGGSIVPAEQVKRERPEKVPLNFGSDAYLTAIISGCTAAAVVGVLAFAIFWYRLQRNAKAAADVEYPAYGVTGPNQESVAAAASSAVSPTPHSGGGGTTSTSPLTTGDRRLAQSAQMYHYQHQKQQIIAMESRASNERRGSVSEVDSEEENEEGDYTVYECPGLAPTGEMEVKNPLFHDDPTPATPSAGNNNGRDQRGDGGGGGKP